MKALRIATLVALLPLLAGAGEPRTNPHGGSDCAACHEVSAPTGRPASLNTACQACHPDAEHHPLGVRSVDVVPPADWPLQDGGVACATCHAEPGCTPGRAPEALRLRGGPYAVGKELCARCHTSATAASRVSPHAHAGRPAADGSCSACHAGRPAPHATGADARLRLEATRVCTTCHPGPVHTGLDAHLGKALARPLDPALAAELPLGPDATIVCWTCHDVHNSAATPEPARRRLGDALAARVRGAAPPPFHETALLAVRVDDGSLCRACHGNGP